MIGGKFVVFSYPGGLCGLWLYPAWLVATSNLSFLCLNGTYKFMAFLRFRMSFFTISGTPNTPMKEAEQFLYDLAGRYSLKVLLMVMKAWVQYVPTNFHNCQSITIMYFICFIRMGSL